MANTAAAKKEAAPVALDNHNSPKNENTAENSSIFVMLKRWTTSPANSLPNIMMPLINANIKMGLETVSSNSDEIRCVVANSVEAVSNIQKPINQNNGLAKQALSMS